MSKVMEFTEYIAPDGSVYRFDTDDKFLLSEEGLGMPPIQYITQTGPYQHGQTLVDYFLNPRTIQLLHRRNACSRIDYWDNRADLLDLIRPNRQLINSFQPGTLLKTLSNGRKRAIKVIIDQGPIFRARDLDKWDEWGIQETLRFIAHDPTFYDPTQVCVSWTLSAADELIFPFTFKLGSDGNGLLFASSVISNNISVTYAGTWMTFPIIQIVGPLSGPQIQNLTTGEFINLNYSIPVGRTVTISLEYGNKTVVDDLGNNLIGAVSISSNLATFHIAPDPEAAGGVNVFNVVGAGAIVGVTSVDLAYYTRYIGI